MENISYEVHKEDMDRLKYAHEGETAMLEIANKRAFILSIILLIALILTNAGWIIHESMYEDTVTETYTTTTDGDNAVFVNGVGDLNYGESDLHENKNPTAEKTN